MSIDALKPAGANHPQTRKSLIFFSGLGETRTPTPVRVTDFESAVSANSTTRPEVQTCMGAVEDTAAAPAHDPSARARALLLALFVQERLEWLLHFSFPDRLMMLDLRAGFASEPAQRRVLLGLFDLCEHLK